MTVKEKKKTRTWDKSRIIRIIFIVTVLLALAGAGAGTGLFIYAARDLPDFDPALLSGAETTFIYDDQDQKVTGLHAGENRTQITLDQVPQDLINAFIATEDRDFYDHHGVNFKGIIRAVVRNLQSADLTGQGASTITQQLARTAFLTFDKKWERKAKEIILAVKIESLYSKDEILTMYLNMINFGSGAYGVQTAAGTYFGKDVSELNLAECSFLAGLPNGPEYYNPYKYYDRAKKRQHDVLYGMVDAGYIDRQTADDAYAAELKFENNQIRNSEYGYFVDAVIDEAVELLKTKELYNDTDSALYRSGLRIYTTMNADLQLYTEEVYSNSSNFLQQKSSSGESVQSAVAVFDHQNGEIKAIMGGRSYDQQRGFNRATSAYRQPGSSIKPITVYSPALEQGIMPFYVLNDSPISYKLSSGVWSPKNYDLTYRGLIPMRTAVQYSVNTYAVQLLDQVGISNGFDFGRSMGLELVDSPGTNDLGLAPLALGGLTHGATPVQMAAAYGTIANGGIYMKPHFIRRIEDAGGHEIYHYDGEAARVMSEQTAWLMGSMLQTVVEAGTGTKARVPGVVTAGKTGTSEEYRDSWFCGFTPAYSTAVWMGFDQKDTMRNYPRDYPGETAYGGNVPASLFSKILTFAHQDYKPAARPMPAGIVQIQVCSISGKLPGEVCPEDKLISDWCLKDCVPEEPCDRHQLVMICPESGKLAGRFCPHPEARVVVVGIEDEKDATENRIPTETCDIHTSLNINNLLRNEIYICTDPRHDGVIYRANIPGPLETGGCPQQYLERYVPEPGEKLPYCPIEEHDVKKVRVKDTIRSMQDD